MLPGGLPCSLQPLQLILLSGLAVMVFLQGLLVAVLVTTATVLASPSAYTTSPIVTLDHGTFIGRTANGTNMFLGIPFAHPPVGNLRFRCPEPLGPYTGEHNATAFGLSCPQQATTAIPTDVANKLPQVTLDTLSAIFETGVTLMDGEDCLTLNVIVPANVEPGSKLPVAVWIYGVMDHSVSHPNFLGLGKINKLFFAQNNF